MIMKKSTRFSSAVHILIMLAAQKEGYLSSDIIATSMGTNRVVVLRLIAALTKAGLVESQTGKLGGAKLACEPNKVTLRDIYRAVEEGPIFRFHSPHPNCKGGKYLTRDLGKIVGEAEKLLEKSLASKTLADSMKSGIKEMAKFLKQA